MKTVFMKLLDTFSQSLLQLYKLPPPPIDKFILNKSYDLRSLSPLLLNPSLPPTFTLGHEEFLLES